MTTILLTGATGYIGSHTWLALHAAGHDVVGLDDFRNSSPRVLDRLRELTGGPWCSSAPTSATAAR
jgi:UDP-glucose 4-epimerase